MIGQISGGGDDDPAAAPAVDAAPVAADSMAAAAEVPAVVEPAAEPEVEGIGNGTHLVGPDIAPGTYRSAGAQEGFFELCIWSTRVGASTNSDIIDFGTANADDQQVVEIGEGVGAFETSNCEPWTLVE